jgi:hypothetical protein
LAETVIQLQGIDNVLAMLAAMPPEVVSKVNGPIQRSIRAGLRPMLKRVRANLQVVTSNATTHPDRENLGLLLKSTIMSRGKPPSNGKGERYLIRVKKRAYPRKSGNGETNTVTNAQRLEYGRRGQPAEPYIRPAFQAEAAPTIERTRVALIAEIDKLAQSYLSR